MEKSEYQKMKELSMQALGMDDEGGIAEISLLRMLAKLALKSATENLNRIERLEELDSISEE